MCIILYSTRTRLYLSRVLHTEHEIEPCVRRVAVSWMHVSQQQLAYIGLWFQTKCIQFLTVTVLSGSLIKHYVRTSKESWWQSNKACCRPTVTLAEMIMTI